MNAGPPAPPGGAVPGGVFRLPRLQADYEREGFTVVPLLDAAEVRELSERFRALPPLPDRPFFASLHSAERAYKEAAHRAVVGFAERACAELLFGYRPLIGNYVSKASGEGSRMPPHQDWSFVDETRFASLNLWCPLVDVDARNGALSLLRGGHRLPFTYRGTGIGSAFAGVPLPLERLAHLPMKAGDLLLYDHRLIHASPPNLGPTLRLAAAIATVPAAAEAVHFRLDRESGTLERYRADHEFYLDYVHGSGAVPADAILCERGIAPPPPLAAADLEPLLEPAPARWRQWLRRSGFGYRRRALTSSQSR